MSLRSSLILVFALVTGMAMAFGVRMMLQPSAPTGTEVVSTDEPQVPVMVAKIDLAVGDELTPQNIRFDRFAESGVPWDAIYHFSDVTDRTLVKPVKAGKLISLKDLNDPDADREKITSFMKPGYQPVPIEIDSVAGIGEEAAGQIKSLVFPEDLVTLSAILEEKEEETDEAPDRKPHQRKLVTKALLEGIPVYKVIGRQRIIDNFGTVKKIALVYVLLNDQQLKEINEAGDNGNLLLTVQKKTVGENRETVSLRALPPNASTEESAPPVTEAPPAEVKNPEPAPTLPQEEKVAPDSEAPKKPSPLDGESAPSVAQSDSAAPASTPAPATDTQKPVSYHAKKPNADSRSFPPIRAARKIEN